MNDEDDGLDEGQANEDGYIQGPIGSGRTASQPPNNSDGENEGVGRAEDGPPEVVESKQGREGGRGKAGCADTLLLMAKILAYGQIAVDSENQYVCNTFSQNPFV